MLSNCRLLSTRVTFVLLALALTAARAANAEPILTFGFTELRGDYDGLTAFFADDGPATAGDVTRIPPTEQSALYWPGFSGGVAGYEMSMILANVTPAGAEGAGSLTITEDDGDTLTGDLGGVWVHVAAFGFFERADEPSPAERDGRWPVRGAELRMVRHGVQRLRYRAL